jgi:hypothetical protein
MLFKKKHVVPEPPTDGLHEDMNKNKIEANTQNLPELPSSKKPQKATITVNEGLPDLPAEIPPERIAMKKEKKDKEMFIKIENFKQIVTAIDDLQKELQHVEELISKIEKINNDEMSEIDTWKSNIAKLKDDILTIGTNLAE